jgi:hypothetical protein
MPLPAVIQFTSPGAMRWTLPRLSRCRSAPSKSHVDAAARREGRRTHVVEKDERPDHPDRVAR